MNEYNEKMKDILNRCEYNKYLFQMTKCCGYSFIQLVYKDNTLNELYHNISLELSHLTIASLFLENINGERLEIPRNAMTVRDFVIANQQWFIPIYPLPSKVVYRIFFDDGHFHIHENNEVNINNNNMIV